VNLLARYSSSPTRRYWNEVKHIFHYIQGNINISLFYSNNDNHESVGYADVGYLSDPYKGRSQIGYLFTCGNIVISLRSTKQILVFTLCNHAEINHVKILAIHKTSR